MEEAEFFTRQHILIAASGAHPLPPELACHSSAVGGHKYLPRDHLRLWLLHLRARPNIQRLVQIGSGLLVLLIVLVCIFTLVTIEAERTSVHQSTARLKSDREESDRLLTIDRSSSVMLSRLASEVKKRPVPLSDVYISVKTSAKFHTTRLAVILKTWFNLAPLNTYFFTDGADPMVSESVGPGHLIVTGCPSDHSRQALCCKMQAEFDHFIASNKRWFCHFDDDQYVNVPGLLRKLSEFPVEQAWYLGKPSIDRPLEILDRDREGQQEQRSIKFWFATGGAGFCLSRPLADRMVALAAQGRFSAVGEKMRLPDDVTMGYIVEQLAGVAMTRLDQFHSHLEPLRLVGNLPDQISFSYSASSGEGEGNLVEVEGEQGWDIEEDPTRFLTIHCSLFPATSWCQDA